MSRRDLGVQLQGIRANSQLSTPCYTAKQDSIVDEQDDREQSPPSPSGTDMEQPPEQQEEQPQKGGKLQTDGRLWPYAEVTDKSRLWLTTENAG